MSRQAYIPEEKLTGYNTFTTEKSQKGLPPDISREQESALPGGSATPNSPRVEDSAGGDGRVIGRPSFNGPASGEPGPAEHPRTIPAPGDDVPTKFDYGMPTRRTMTGYNAWKPGQRRHKRVGPAKRKRHQTYMKNRSRSKVLHKKWHMRNKNKPAFKRRVQLRKRSPNRFKMRFSAYVPDDILFWFGPAMVDGRVDSVSEDVVTFSPLEGVGADEVYNLSPAAFLASVVFQTTQDSNEMFEVFDDVLDGSAYDDLTPDDLRSIARLYGVPMPDVGSSDPDSLADVAAKIVEDAMDGLDAPDGSVSRVAAAHLRGTGEVILYDQRSPEEGTWESPDLGGDRPYSQGGPDQHRWDPGAKAPSGGGGLSLPSDAGQWGVGSGKVIPEHLKYGSEDPREWIEWMVKPIATIWAEHKQFVYGPIDDVVDEIIRKIAPSIVRAVGEREVDEGVEQFLAGAAQGRADVLGGAAAPPKGEDDDFWAGYDWGIHNPDVFDGEELPDAVKRKVVQENIQWFKGRVTEEVVEDLLRKAWHAVSPVTTFKAIVRAVRMHGWKLGVSFALFELFEHAILPSLAVALTGDAKWAILGTLPIGEIVYAVAFRVLGRAPKELDKLEEDGHLDWYEEEYGDVRLASRVAATIGDIESRTSKDVAARARDVRIRLSRADPKQGIWTFKASGSKGNSYTIRVKASRKGNTKEVGKLQVKVSCDCDFFRFQGPEHWARSEGYLYGKPRGTASAPTVMDPGKQHWACKHVLAVLSGHVKKYRVAAEELVLPPDTEVVPDFERGASASRVAARYGVPHVGTNSRA